MRLAHCSDPHLLSLRGAKVRDFANKRWIGGLNLANRGRRHQARIFEAMVADINELGVDHVVVTGDVTNIAMEEEFRYARTYFDKFEVGAKQVTVLPGNHDAYVQAGSEHFQKHFGPFCESDIDFGWPDNNVWPCVRRRGPVTVIALSTSVQTPWFTAYGRLGELQLERLKIVLGDERLKNTLRVIAIHHPPTEPRARSPFRGLHDFAKLRQILETSGAELILHGHEHVDLRTKMWGPEGPIWVRGIQSATYDGGDGGDEGHLARYRIYEFADTPGEHSRPQPLSERLRRWDSGAEAFTDCNSSV